MLRDSDSFYLPNLYTFQNGNTFIGSFRGLRFRVAPDKEGEAPTLSALVWYGEYCLELSDVQGESAFPLTEEGREALLDWLEAEFIRFQAQNGGK
ncbi:MAG: hypothetical protein HFF18_02285 [Oscillospiraceae bacterium]|nr:hypothetical protein [Oscillospiraceae bacterium]